MSHNYSINKHIKKLHNSWLGRDKIKHFNHHLIHIMRKRYSHYISSGLIFDTKGHFTQKKYNEYNYQYGTSPRSGFFSSIGILPRSGCKIYRLFPEWGKFPRSGAKIVIFKQRVTN